MKSKKSFKLKWGSYMLPYGKKYICAPTILHQVISVFQFTIQCLKYYALSLLHHHSFLYFTANRIFVSLCMILIILLRLLSGRTTFLHINQCLFPLLPPYSICPLSKKTLQMLLLPWAPPTSGLPRLLLPHFHPCD